MINTELTKVEKRYITQYLKKTNNEITGQSVILFAIAILFLYVSTTTQQISLKISVFFLACIISIITYALMASLKKKPKDINVLVVTDRFSTHSSNKHLHPYPQYLLGTESIVLPEEWLAHLDENREYTMKLAEWNIGHSLVLAIEGIGSIAE